jgi:hypothetical protein
LIQAGGTYRKYPNSYFLDVLPITIRPIAVLVGEFPGYHLEWMTLNGCIGILIILIPFQAVPGVHFQTLFM